MNTLHLRASSCWDEYALLCSDFHDCQATASHSSAVEAAWIGTADDDVKTTDRAMNIKQMAGDVNFFIIAKQLTNDLLSPQARCCL
jgi:hypothetical protein